MLFVAGATLFSLVDAGLLPRRDPLAAAAAQFDLRDFHLLLLLLPHAMPELTALFLPLAAWLIASRRGDWDQLLAATFVTVGVAVPTLLLSVSSRPISSPADPSQRLVAATRGRYVA